MTESKERRAAEIQDAIRQVLFRDWDPIGVNENEYLRDEYDGYIARVYRVLVGSRSENDLVQLLYRIELEEIGAASRSPEELRPIAEKLLSLDVRL
jgi:hypothetical protein